MTRRLFELNRPMLPRLAASRFRPEPSGWWPRAFLRDPSDDHDYIPRMTTIEAIRDDFGFLDEWEDRYRYVIDLGAALPPFPDPSRIDTYKVPGCVSQVWLTTRVGGGSDPIIEFQGDSDAHIVRGLVAIMLALFSGRR